MSAHVRKQIRLAFVDALSSVGSTAGRVFATRVSPLSQDELPALLVYAMSEDSGRLTMGANPTLQRQLTVAVQIVMNQSGAIDDALDAIAESVEEAVMTSAGIAALVKNVELTATRIQMAGEGDTRALGAVLEFSTTYHTADGAPGTMR